MVFPLTINQEVTHGVPRFSMPEASDRMSGLATFRCDDQTKWGWACRSLPSQHDYSLLTDDTLPPLVGDVAVFELETIRNHTRILTADHERMRLYPGDKLVGVFGNRYATDAFEATVENSTDLSILTSAGMVGNVVSRHASTKSPTKLRLVGYLARPDGSRINMKAGRVETVLSPDPSIKVVLAVGTGMNAGKTTTAAKLVKSLLRRGLRVAANKVTGSVCHRDLFELRSTSAHDVRDFSDYGFPSTYLCEHEELVGLFDTMVADSIRVNPDIVVMEIADGVLQRETKMILSDPRIRQHISGVVLAAPCSSSALFGVDRIRGMGHEVIGVSGIISNSPLFMQEFSEQSDVALASSTGDADGLATLVMEHCRVAVS